MQPTTHRHQSELKRQTSFELIFYFFTRDSFTGSRLLNKIRLWIIGLHAKCIKAHSKCRYAKWFRCSRLSFYGKEVRPINLLIELFFFSPTASKLSVALQLRSPISDQNKLRIERANAIYRCCLPDNFFPIGQLSAV